jgi:predicted TIM-barrel fold metal-dependent hydrolase
MTGTSRIWDLHCHISGNSGRTPEERITALLDYAARLGIERLCISMGLNLATHPTPEQLRQQNDEVIAALAHYHDRAFGLCYVSGQHVEASLRELDRCIRDGPMVGVKLWVSRRASDSSLDAIVDHATKLQAPILQHTWFKTDGSQQVDESTPSDLATLARRRPQARLILGHCGGTWELGIRAVRNLANVVVETAGSDPTTGFVEMAVRELGPERIVYSSDVPGRSFGSQLAKVLGADVPETAKQLILSGNLRRLLGPILRAKGLRSE